MGQATRRPPRASDVKHLKREIAIRSDQRFDLTPIGPCDRISPREGGIGADKLLLFAARI
jgi:hypothetical protein